MNIICSNNVNNYATELTVAEAYEDDVGRGIARVGPDVLSELDVSPGDVCLVIGDHQCPVKVWRADREDWDNGNVFLDQFTRVNTQAEVNTEVTVKPVETAVAEKIVLNLYRGYEIEFGSNAVDKIKAQWVKRPVSIGDVVPLFTDKHNFIPLVIGKIEPDGVSIIKDATDLRVNTD